MNPYGVSGPATSREQRRSRCACCRIWFTFDAPATATAPRWCPACRHHYPTPGESRQRRLARFEEHEPRVVEQLDAAWEAAAKAGRGQVNAEQATAAALQDRSRWRALVREIHQLHHEVERRRCACGLDKFPCVTAQALQEADTWIAEWLEEQPRLPPRPDE